MHGAVFSYLAGFLGSVLINHVFLHDSTTERDEKSQRTRRVQRARRVCAAYI